MSRKIKCVSKTVDNLGELQELFMLIKNRTLPFDDFKSLKEWFFANPQ